jgi:hypothetical protein
MSRHGVLPRRWHAGVQNDTDFLVLWRHTVKAETRPSPLSIFPIGGARDFPIGIPFQHFLVSVKLVLAQELKILRRVMFGTSNCKPVHTFQCSEPTAIPGKLLKIIGLMKVFSAVTDGTLRAVLTNVCKAD